MKVKLTQPHTHAGVRYDKGAELEVDHVTAKWLTDRNVAEPVKSGVSDAKVKQDKGSE